MSDENGNDISTAHLSYVKRKLGFRDDAEKWDELVETVMAHTSLSQEAAEAGIIMFAYQINGECSQALRIKNQSRRADMEKEVLYVARTLRRLTWPGICGAISAISEDG